MENVARTLCGLKRYRCLAGVLTASALAFNGWCESSSSALLPDIVVADFEGTNYGSWTVDGDAFGVAPARGTLPGQMAVDGFLGKGLVNSFVNGDRSQGTLTSPSFKFERAYLKFLIGGGGFAGKTCINLLVDGEVVRTATGLNTQPGGSEHLDWQSWDVSEFRGKSGVIQIVDHATGGWGHINIDQITQTDRKLPGWIPNATREIQAEKRWLNLPVKNGAPKHIVRVVVNGKTEREFEIELANAEPDWWAFLDLAPFEGKKLNVVVDKLPEDSTALSSMVQTDQILGAENLYREALRPQFHFSPQRGWNNDPNGMVYSDGEYHLFFQHNPYGWDWGNMHWGHAVSRDLVHWTQLPIAVYPYRYGDWAFSGSAVVDWQNTSGFKSGKENLLVAAYTSTGRGECILYSNDRGRTWTEYSGNPVVKHKQDGRDPRLFWHAQSKQWVMAVYDESDGKRWFEFYTSPNLKDWSYQSRVEGFFECPDMFPLALDGDAAKTKWVLTGASSEYMVGEFDGKTFKPETAKLPGHKGANFYAAQTFSDIPAADGRRIQIGWGNIATPGMPFNQMMCFPCELRLITTSDGPRVAWQPVREIESLWDRTISIKPQALAPGQNPLSEVKGELFDILAELNPGGASEVGLVVRGTPVVYDSAKKELSCHGKKVILKSAGDCIRLRVLVDRTSLEIFVNDGVDYMPIGVTPPSDNRSLEAFAKGGTASIKALTVHELKSAWQ